MKFSSTKKSYYRDLTIYDEVLWESLSEIQQKHPVNVYWPERLSCRSVPNIATVASLPAQGNWDTNTMDWLAVGLVKRGYPTFNFGMRFGGSCDGDLNRFQYAERFLWPQVPKPKQVIWIGIGDYGNHLDCQISQSASKHKYSLVWLGSNKERDESNRLYLPPVNTTDEAEEDVGFEPELTHNGDTWKQLISWLDKHHPLPDPT